MTQHRGADAEQGLTEDDRRVICERYFGGEHASPALLARAFGVSHQRITTLLIEGSRA